MSDALKTIRHRHKTAVLPIPGQVWDGMPPIAQLALLVMESAKFMAAMHKQEVGGFQVVILRANDTSGDHEVVLSVGAEEEKNSGLVVPPSGLIRPN